MQHEFNYDSVTVLDSLGPGDEPTGQMLYDNVLLPFERTITSFRASRHLTPDRDSLLGRLNEERRRAEAGAIPIIHIESHGTPDGIRTASGETVSWEDLRDSLTALNAATRFNLLLVMAMCHGGHLAKAVRPPRESPVFGVIGPDTPVGDKSLYRGMAEHYRTLLNGSDGSAAISALNRLQSKSAWRYVFRSAEALFHEVLRRFIANRTPEVVTEHENTLVAEYVAAHGLDLNISMQARQIAAARLSDNRYWYDFFRPIFLMLDRFPENKARFKMTYEDFCVYRDDDVVGNVP